MHDVSQTRVKRARPIVFVAVATGVHFVVSLALFSSAFGIGMSRLDDGRLPTTGESLVVGLSTVLLVPFALVGDLIPAGWFSGKWGYILFLSNSLVWGLCIYLAFVVYRRWRLSRPAG
jgi:hypothetical protein